LVGILTDPSPGINNIPELLPVDVLNGIINPALGTNIPFLIVPLIGLELPVGVKIAAVPSGTLLPANAIVKGVSVPTVPVIGVEGAVPNEYTVLVYNPTLPTLTLVINGLLTLLAPVPD
jgi:hypothetical protein